MKEGKSRHIILNYEFINAHLHRYGNVTKVYSSTDLLLRQGGSERCFFQIWQKILEKTVFINITDPYPDRNQFKFEFCQKGLNKRECFQTSQKNCFCPKVFFCKHFKPYFIIKKFQAHIIFSTCEICYFGTNLQNFQYFYLICKFVTRVPIFGLLSDANNNGNLYFI